MELTIKGRAKLGPMHVVSFGRSSTEAIELAWNANAFIDSAVRLCDSLMDDEWERSRHHYRVPLHLAYLALELNFKAGLAAAKGRYPHHHDLVELRRLYEEVMPLTPLPVPAFLERLLPLPIGELFEDDPAASAAWHFTRLRYVTDTSGRPFPELELADVRELRDELEELRVAGIKVLLDLEAFGPRTTGVSGSSG